MGADRDASHAILQPQPLPLHFPLCVSLGWSKGTGCPSVMFISGGVGGANKQFRKRLAAKYLICLQASEKHNLNI